MQIGDRISEKHNSVLIQVLSGIMRSEKDMVYNDGYFPKSA